MREECFFSQICFVYRCYFLHFSRNCYKYFPRTDTGQDSPCNFSPICEGKQICKWLHIKNCFQNNSDIKCRIILTHGNLIIPPSASITPPLSHPLLCPPPLPTPSLSSILPYLVQTLSPPSIPNPIISAPIQF